MIHLPPPYVRSLSLRSRTEGTITVDVGLEELPAPKGPKAMENAYHALHLAIRTYLSAVHAYDHDDTPNFVTLPLDDVDALEAKVKALEKEIQESLGKPPSRADTIWGDTVHGSTLHGNTVHGNTVHGTSDEDQRQIKDLERQASESEERVESFKRKVAEWQDRFIALERQAVADAERVENLQIHNVFEVDRGDRFQKKNADLQEKNADLGETRLAHALKLALREERLNAGLRQEATQDQEKIKDLEDQLEAAKNSFGSRTRSSWRKRCRRSFPRPRRSKRNRFFTVDISKLRGLVAPDRRTREGCRRSILDDRRIGVGETRRKPGGGRRTRTRSVPEERRSASIERRNGPLQKPGIGRRSGTGRRVSFHSSRRLQGQGSVGGQVDRRTGPRRRGADNDPRGRRIGRTPLVRNWEFKERRRNSGCRRRADRSEGVGGLSAPDPVKLDVLDHMVLSFAKEHLKGSISWDDRRTGEGSRRGGGEPRRQKGGGTRRNHGDRRSWDQRRCGNEPPGVYGYRRLRDERRAPGIRRKEPFSTRRVRMGLRREEHGPQAGGRREGDR